MNHQTEFVKMDKNKLLRESLKEVLIILHAKERTRWDECDQPVCVKARLALNSK